MGKGKEENDDRKISKRTFLKTISGSFLGISVVMASPITSKASNIFDAVNDKFKIEEGIIYRDSFGRNVEITKKVNKVVPAGVFAQTVLEILCPEKMGSLAKAIDENEIVLYEKSNRGFLYELPITGVMHIDKRIMGDVFGIRTKTIRNIAADLIIDIGAAKSKHTDKLSEIQYSTEIPTLYIDASVGNLASMFLFLGQLFDCTERAEKIAKYIDNLYLDIYEKRNKIESDMSVFYAANEMGNFKKSDYSFQDEIINMLGLKTVGNISVDSRDRIKTSCIQGMSTDIVVFNNWECYEKIAQNTGEEYVLWKNTAAVKEGLYGVSPGLFHSWVGSPVLVQLIGAAWLGKFVYPDIYDYDMSKFTIEFYELFYDYSMTTEDAEKILQGNIEKLDFNVAQDIEEQLKEKMQYLEDIGTHTDLLV